MKKIKLIIIVILMFLVSVLMFPNKTFASELVPNLRCNNTTLKAGETTTCSISVTVQSGKIVSFESYINVSANLELLSLTDDPNWDGGSSNGNFIAVYGTPKTGTITIGTFNIKVKSNVSNTTEEVKLTNMVITDEIYDSITPSDITQSITVPRLPSAETNLQNLTIDKGKLSPSFDANTTKYTATVDDSNVTITAIKPDKGSVSGAGYKTLNYGNNTFDIVSKSENGTTKTYTITIYRPDNRSAETGLKTISKDITATTATIYNYTIPSSSDSYTLNAEAYDSKATISYSPSATVNLNYGETKSVVITVTAERGNTKTYTVNLTRKDGRSSNNKLKKLSIKNQELNFKANTLNYTVTVENDVNEIEIEAESEDAKSKIEGIGKHKIEVGSNTFKIVVTADDGSTKTYVLTVLRKNENGEVENLSNNTKIKNIKINGENIKLKNNIYTYSISYTNDIETANIEYELDDEKATATLEGDSNLIVGNNTFKIKVIAEDGSTKTYEIVIKRNELQTIIENKKDSIMQAINDSTDETIVIEIKHNDFNRSLDEELIDVLRSSEKTLMFQVLNENGGINYSFKLEGKNINKETKKIDYNISFENEFKDILKEYDLSKVMYLNFSDKNEFRGKIILNLFVGEKLKNNGLYLYKINKETKELQLIKSNLKIKDKYVEIDLNELSNYILIEGELKQNSSNLILLIIAAVGAIIIIEIIIIIAIKKKKKKTIEIIDI